MLAKIVGASLANRSLVVLGALLLAGLGARAWFALPVDAFPDVSPNLVQVFTVTEGLAPEEVELYVTYPVEVAMSGLPGVERTRSVSNFGLSVVSIYFEEDVDIYFARQLVGERLQEARGQIPPGFGEPKLGPISTGMGLVLYYYLDDSTGRYSLQELRDLQDWVLKYHLQTVPGVTEVLGIGGWEKQFQVDLCPRSLLQYNLDVTAVVSAIERGNLNVGAQFIEKGAEEFTVRSVGLATGIGDLESIVLKSVAGRPVFLRDVAVVAETGAIRRGAQTRGGVGEVVAGNVIKLFGANSSAVIAAVETKLEGINAALPEGVRVVPYYEQKSLVAAAVRTVTGALLQGVILVVAVLLALMGGWRPSLVAALAIPFALLVAVLGMDRLDITANLMSLGGLAIAIGMLVDGAIVLAENTDRRLRTAPPDADRRGVASAAALEVLRPVSGAVFMVILVFTPLLTLHGVEGKTFGPLAECVALAMGAALIYTVVLAPVLASLVQRAPRRAPAAGQAPREASARLARLYRPLAAAAVRRPWLAALLAAGMIAGGVVAGSRLGSEFTPRLQEGTIVVELTRAPSISLQESIRQNLLVERRLLAIPEVDDVVSRIGRGEVGAHAHPVNSAELLVRLKPRDQWREHRTQAAVEAAIRERLADVPGARWHLTQPIEGSVAELLEGIKAPLAVKLYGEDLDELRRLAGEIAGVLHAVPGAAEVEVDQVSGAPQLRVRIDREAIARYGLNVADVQDVVAAAVGGAGAGEVFEGDRRYPIVVRYEERARDSARAIADIVLHTPDGVHVPLGSLAHIAEVVGPRQITRENARRFIAVRGNVVGRDIGSFVAEAQDRLAAELALPPGYLLEWAGQYRLQQQANRRLAVVIPLTLAAISALLLVSMPTVRSALVIAMVLPVALSGGAIALWLGGLNASVPATVGFIALFGIALGNAMVMVTRMDQLRHSGLAAPAAALAGAVERLRPVLMTALTTGLGLLPLLMAEGTGSEVQRPLATVVIGGLLTATLVTLVLVPAVYAVVRRR
ncbi:MAG: CusA/CzcA family heavy metal efflux RND transporter [Candidatus Krumholzibacteria bacterium]|nr:CusA/CzcA family heavy metal efflux RND transporter [Candidatus Krumholzibacteria bacterium]